MTATRSAGRPAGMLRAPDWHARGPFAGASQPGQPEPGGYAPPPTGPLPALTQRPPVFIGDQLASDPQWAGKCAPLPCGHCGAVLDTGTADVLHRTRIIGHLNWIAWGQGWAFDYDMTWTCPDCQRGEAWRARQGQLAIWQPADEGCDRHPGPGLREPGHPCTCPAALLAVDVMLTSEDYLGSGTGRHRAAAR